MKSKGRHAKMLLVPVKLNENDLLVFSFSDSKRTFYKSLSNASQILGSYQHGRIVCGRIKVSYLHKSVIYTKHMFLTHS